MIDRKQVPARVRNGRDEPPCPEAILWREANHRCELWTAADGYQLRVYVFDVLTHSEAVRPGTCGLQQAAKLLAAAQAATKAARIGG